MISAAPLKVDIRRAHVWPVVERWRGGGRWRRVGGRGGGACGGGGWVGSLKKRKKKEKKQRLWLCRSSKPVLTVANAHPKHIPWSGFEPAKSWGRKHSRLREKSDERNGSERVSCRRLSKGAAFLLVPVCLPVCAVRVGTLNKRLPSS